MVTQVTQQDFRPTGGKVVITAADRLTAAGSTDWVRFENGSIVASVGGTATAFTGIVERSAVDPANSNPLSSAVPADSVGLTGDLTTGVVPNVYTEPSVGWWRVRATTVTGGYANVSLAGVVG